MPRTNGVVRLRAGLKSTVHVYLSISCLLCTANVDDAGQRRAASMGGLAAPATVS